MKIYYTERTKTVVDKLSWLTPKWIKISSVSQLPLRMKYLSEVFLSSTESQKAQVAADMPGIHIVSIEAIESPEFQPGRNDPINLIELPRSFWLLDLDAAFDDRVRSEGRI
jgi:hypothetical protein